MVGNFENHRMLVYDLVIAIGRDYDFYAHILSQLTKVEVEGESTYSRDFSFGKTKDCVNLKFYYNKTFIDNQIKNYTFDRAYVDFFERIKHEMLHFVFRHYEINLPDKKRFAVAADLSVNSYLDKNKFIIDENNNHFFPEDFSLDAKQSLIWYYQQLLENPKYKSMLTGSDGSGDTTSQEISHANWQELETDELAKNFAENIIKNASDFCKASNKWGNIPEEIKELVADMLEVKKPLLPWQRVLKLFVASNSDVELDYTMRRKSKRFGCRPGTKKEAKLKLAIGIDTSGSISNEQLALFMNELKWIEKEGAYIHVYECDTEIHRDYPFKKYDGAVTGRGGTDLEPVIAKVSEEKYDALIYFTDFEAPKIEINYNIPVLFVLSQCRLEKQDFPYLFPRVIYIKIADEGTGCERVE